MARVGGAGGGLGKHIDGETRPESAAPRELDEGGEKVALEPVVLLDEEGEQIDQTAAKKRVGAAQAYMQKCRRKKTRGGNRWARQPGSSPARPATTARRSRLVDGAGAGLGAGLREMAGR